MRPSPFSESFQRITQIKPDYSFVPTAHLDLEELGAVEDEGEEGGRRDVVHGAYQGRAVRREGLVAQRVADGDVPSIGR